MDLHVCDDCLRPFVVPVSVLDVIDGDRCVVELACNNCGTVTVGVHEDEALEALDIEIARAHAAVCATLEVFELTAELVRVDRFVEALHADLLLPEDF